MESKLITFIGAPASGKSTLASDVHTELKKIGKNSIYALYLPVWRNSRSLIFDFLSKSDNPYPVNDYMAFAQKHHELGKLF
jgi:predicted kinase